MNIIICENLKELRKNKNITQEDLAAFLDVSISAVSKWERSECYPDIELLPKLAAYYNISVDELLGVGEINKRKRIEEYEEKSHHFANIGDTESRLAVWREAQKEFPNDWTVLSSLKHALFVCRKESDNAQESIEIGKKILAECTIDNYRYGAIQTMCYLYNDLGDFEKVKEYASMAPDYYITSNELFKQGLQGEELLYHVQGNIINLCQALSQEIFWYGWHYSGLKDEKPDEAKHIMLKAIKVYELVYENGDYGFYHVRMDGIYGSLAWIAAGQGNKDETLEYLSKAVEYAIKYDIYATQEDGKHTSPLVNRRSYNPKGTSKDYMSNVSYLRLKKMDDSRYDFCREDIRFIKLIDDLKKVAKENASE